MRTPGSQNIRNEIQTRFNLIKDVIDSNKYSIDEKVKRISTISRKLEIDNSILNIMEMESRKEEKSSTNNKNL